MKEMLKCGGQKKFIVLNEGYMERIPARLRNAVNEAALFIAAERAVDKKDPCPEYIVINTDEPYIAEIINVLKRNGAWG